MAETDPNHLPIDPKKLRALRVGRFMTRKKLALRSGLSVAAIAKIENGARGRQPRLDTIEKLIAGLECELDDLTPDQESAA